MSISIKGIDVAVLFVADVERAKAFYRDTLGLPLNFEDEASAYFQLEKASLLVLSIPGAQELLPSDAVAAPGTPGARSQLVAFVEDVDAIYTELVAKGVEFIREPADQEWGLRTAHFKDPDGHVWEISHPLS